MSLYKHWREQDHFKELLAHKERLVPFVGAGFSMPTCPSWWGFLEAFKAEVEDGFLDEPDIQQLAQYGDAGNTEAYANLLVARARRGKTNHLLTKFFGKGSPSGSALTRYRVFHEAFPGMKLTTNFDSLLEATAPSALYKIHGNLEHELNDAFSRLANGGLLKIHGGIDNPKSIILTSEQYERAYGSPSGFDGSAALPMFLKRVFENQSLLFMGCSLARDRTMEVLVSCEVVRPHYALMKVVQKKQEKIAVNRRLSEFQISPIWLEDHDQITEVLAEITRHKTGSPGITPVVAPDSVEALGRELQSAHDALDEAEKGGVSTRAIKDRILQLKRRLRDGGHLRAGDILSKRYLLLEPLGKGGFGTVWKAMDRVSRDVVALKVLHGQYSRDRTRRERFFRGARKMAGLKHPSVVRVLQEKAEDHGFHYFVMDYLEGGDFREVVLAGEVASSQLLAWILVVGEVLGFAHDHGLVHRDIKPGNVMLDGGGKVYLTDFDLVRARDTTGGTRTAAGLGSFIYAAPELMENSKDAGPPSDIYGLGMTTVFALLGQDLPVAALRDSVRFLEKMKLSKELHDVLAKAVAWEVSDRYQSAAHFCRDLKKAMAPSGFKGFQNQSAFNPGDGWIYLKPGSFEMGDDGSKYEDEKPAHTVAISRPFWMGRYPVTNEAFGRFMAEKGYETREFWSDEGWAWLQLKGQNYDRWYKQIKSKYKGTFKHWSPEWFRPGNEPRYIKHENFNQALQPVVGISWFEAEAYCRWLSEKFPKEWLAVLPTEAQWEWAARGEDGRHYPWGNEEPTANFANFNNELNKTSVVGRYPQGVTANGIYDMAGNVWEWCRDCWSTEVYKNRVGDPVADPLNRADDGAVRVLRGGAWLNEADYLRASSRIRFLVWVRDSAVGFRCCLVARSPEHD